MKFVYFKTSRILNSWRSDDCTKQQREWAKQSFCGITLFAGNKKLSPQLSNFIIPLQTPRSSLMRLGSFLPTDDQHYFSTKGSRLRYQLIFPSPLSPIIKPNLYEIKIESWCLIMVPELDDNINMDKFWKKNNEDYTKCKIYVDYIIFMTHDWLIMGQKQRFFIRHCAEVQLSNNEDLVLAAIRHFVSNNLNSELGKISLVRGWIN